MGTCRIQRRVNRYAQTHALLDRVGEGMETASHLQVFRAGCRLYRVDGYERHKVAHRLRNSVAIHAMHALQRTHCMYGMRDQKGLLHG